MSQWDGTRRGRRADAAAGFVPSAVRAQMQCESVWIITYDLLVVAKFEVVLDDRVLVPVLESEYHRKA